MGRKYWLVALAFIIGLTGGCGNSVEVRESVETEIFEEELVDEDLMVIGVDEDRVYDETAVEELLESLTLREKIGQMLIPAVQIWYDESGYGTSFTEMNEEVQGIFEEFQFGGVILFQSNIQENEQIRELTEAFSQTSKKTGMLIGVDQEGGFITRITNGTNGPGNMAVAASGDKEIAYQEALLISSELNALGFNLNFAPDLDINTNPANPIIGVRSFSDDGDTAAVYALQYQKGMAENSVISCGKHFPGHGDTAVDSHTGLPLVEKELNEIQNNELIPFAMAIEKGLPMVMTAHIQYPLIEDTQYTSVNDGSFITLPATLSQKIVTGVLREQMGFEGVVVTDSLQMGAIVNHFDVFDVAMLAINAGVDILLMPFVISSNMDRSYIESYINGILEMVNDGRIPEERITESCRRILRLKNSFGLLKENPEPQYSTQIVGSAEHRGTERMLADSCVTVLENRNGILPIYDSEEKVFILAAPNSELLNSMICQFEQLKKEGKISENASYYGIDYMYGDNAGELYSYLLYGDYAILCSDNYSGYDLNVYYSGNIATVGYAMDLCAEYGIPSIVISANLPYDTAVLKEADALLAVYGNIGKKSMDDTDNQNYGVNVPAGLDIIFGYSMPRGILPIDIPIFSDGWFQNEIEYYRGYGLTWE